MATAKIIFLLNRLSDVRDLCLSKAPFDQSPIAPEAVRVTVGCQCCLRRQILEEEVRV